MIITQKSGPKYTKLMGFGAMPVSTLIRISGRKISAIWGGESRTELFA
jgi:hypothetical protein